MQYITRSLPALRDTGPVQTPDEEWKQFARSQSRYFKSFITEALAYVDGFHQSAEHLLDISIQQALTFLGKEQDCVMRLVGIELSEVVLFKDNQQYVHIIGVVWAEPIKGEVPVGSPMRKYQRRQKER